MGEDQAGEKAQALAARWNALVGEFTGGDAAIAGSVGRMWADRANWPKDVDAKSPSIKPEVWGLISRANAVRKA